MNELGVRWDHPAHGKINVVDPERAIVEDLAPDGTPRTRVAIVGFANSTKDEAPYDDPSVSIWTLNQLYRLVPRASRHFEIHRNWNEHVVAGTDHAGWIKSAQIPVYMVDRLPGAPNSVRFPLVRVIEHVGIRYFTSTVAYMVGLALLEGFKDIGLYGIDLIAGTEWFHQKPCVEFLLGIAHERGLVRIPDRSALLQASYLYGYEMEPPSLLRMTEVEQRLNGIKLEKQKLLQRVCELDGAENEAEMYRQVMELRERGGTVGLPGTS